MPVGGLFTGLWALALSAAAPSFVGAIICLVALGFAAGFFIVPLTAFLQQRTPGGERGRLVATSNVAATVGILLAALLVASDSFRENSASRRDEPCRILVH